jgi:hypothetical protein
MSSKKIRRPITRTERAIVRSVVPKSFNWICLKNYGEKIFLNLDQISRVVFSTKDGCEINGHPFNSDSVDLHDAIAVANLRAHLEMIGVCIDHAAEIQRGAESPAPGCACLTPAPAAPPARFCRVCGCTEDQPCVNLEGQGCHWVAEDLCSACSSSSSSPASLDDPKVFFDFDSSCGD